MGEWKRVRLEDACEGIFDCPHSTAPDEGRGYPLIRTPNVGRGRLKLENVHRVSKAVYDKRNARAIPTPGDLIFAREAPAGNVACVQPGQWVCLGQRTVLIRPQKELLDSNYLAYHLLSPKLQASFGVLANGATVSHINIPDIRNLEVDLPPLPTQRRIAAVLGALDDKIEVNRKICENLEAQAQALFKAWFVDDGSRVQATKQMQEVFDVTIGRTPPRKEFEWFSEAKDDNVTWASIADMGSCGMFLADSSEYLTPAAVQRFKLVMIPRGTVLLSFKLTVGRVAIADVDMVSNEAIAHLRTDNTSMREYLYCYLKQYDFDTLGSTSSIATAVNSTTIKEMPFRVPTDAALVDFHNVARPIFDLIRSKLQESRALAAMRDALLPKLMSGELAVEKVEGF